MNRKLFFVVVAFAIAVNLTVPAFAGATDYVFEPVKADVKKGDDVVVSVRLKHKPTGKPVTDAVIVQTRIDMGPDGMGEMASPLTAVPSNEPSTSEPSPVLAFRASAAAMPPANDMPLRESPKPPAGMPMGDEFAGVSEADTEPRDQKVIES